MKKISTAIYLMAITSTAATASPDTLTGTAGSNIQLTGNTCYILKNCLTIPSGKTLVIPAGVKILAMQNAALIIEPGGKIEASGAINNPVIFTSIEAPGSRTPGYWKYIMIGGNAPYNDGKLDMGPCSVQQAGGNNASGNSGWLHNVQIHFAGQEDAGNDIRKEAALVLLAAGSGTELENIQISNSATNGVNFAAGTVNIKGLYCLDNYRNDVFISDGYTGMQQLIYAERRNTAAHHPDGSNGIVIQNNTSGNNATPRTAPVISNATVNGIRHCYTGSVHADFGHAVLLKNNARATISNSVFAYSKGYGVFVQDVLTATQTATNPNYLNLMFCSFHENAAGDYGQGAFTWNGNGCSSSIANWIENGTSACSEAANQFDPVSGVDPAYDASFCEDYCSNTPHFVIDDDATALDPYTYTSLAGFFDLLDYRGAIQDYEVFEDSWIETCPKEAGYCGESLRKINTSSLKFSPNPATNFTRVQFESQHTGKALVMVMDKITGKIWYSGTHHLSAKGTQYIDLPLKGMPDQVYTVRIVSGHGVQHGQLIIRK